VLFNVDRLSGPLLLGVGLCIAISCAGAWIALSAIRYEWRSFHPRRSSQNDAPVLPGFRSISFEVNGVAIHGEYVDSKNGRVVILVHGSEATSSAMREHGQLFDSLGYGVLLFDWPGHGRSGGTPTWDELERKVLRSAVDYCLRQSGIGRTGVFGIGVSSGAYILAQVAAKDPRLTGVVLEGCFTSARELNAWQYRRYGWLSIYPALWADRHYGMNIDFDQPIDVVRNIAPRAIFVITGTADQVVPANMSRRLFDAARVPKDFWAVDGATHGDYYAKSPEEYALRVTGFFDMASKLGIPP
jgi:uncharacterized protein